MLYINNFNHVVYDTRAVGVARTCLGRDRRVRLAARTGRRETQSSNRPAAEDRSRSVVDFRQREPSSASRPRSSGTHSTSSSRCGPAGVRKDPTTTSGPLRRPRPLRPRAAPGSAGGRRRPPGSDRGRRRRRGGWKGEPRCRLGPTGGGGDRGRRTDGAGADDCVAG